MKQFIFLVSFAVLVACGQATSGGIGTGETVDVDSGSAASGATIYSSNCNTCHGADGVSGSSAPVDITGDALSTDVAEAVRQGPGTMTVFSQSDISTSELNDLLAYMKITFGNPD